MNKNIRKILALLLTVAFAVTCVSTVAFAATEDNVMKVSDDGGYLAFGDSVAAGVGTTGYSLGEYENYENFRSPTGAYVRQIADAVGCEYADPMNAPGNFWPVCFPGMALSNVMDLYGIDDNLVDSDFNYRNYDEMLRYFGYEGSDDYTGCEEAATKEDIIAKYGSLGAAGSIIDLTEKADLITLQLGMGDVFFRTYRIASGGMNLSDGFNFDADTLKQLPTLVTTAIREMYNGFSHWTEYYPVLIEKILELKKEDATVVLVGNFNLLQGLTLADETLVPLGDAATVISASMNALMRQWAKKYGVTYVDVTNAETASTENNWSLLGEFMSDSYVSTHPTQKGYDYIYRQILAALPEAAPSEPETSATDIVVDLGRFSSVDKVLVNGIPLSSDRYSMNGYVLTVPCNNVLANNLTVTVKNENGTTAVITYDLKYTIGKGYTAYRVYGTNDIAGTVTKPVKAVSKISSTIRSLFGNMLNR